MGENEVGDKTVEEVEFVVVADGYLMSEIRITTDVVTVTVFLELFGKRAGTEKSEVEDLQLVVIHQFVNSSVTEKGRGGLVVLVFGLSVRGEDGAGVGNDPCRTEIGGQDVTVEVAVAQGVVGLKTVMAPALLPMRMIFVGLILYFFVSKRFLRV